MKSAMSSMKHLMEIFTILVKMFPKDGKEHLLILHFNLDNMTNFFFAAALIALSACAPKTSEPVATNTRKINLITLDPGHFHAALVQKSMYAEMDSTVRVYANEGNDLQLHLDRIKQYNASSEAPTTWKEIVYTGDDFFEQMLADKAGNLVVLAGNNLKKTQYILGSLKNGMNVLADKPMAIDRKGYDRLKEAFRIAEENNVLLYDIMTERFEITSVLQRELSMIKEIFGTLEKGDIDNPAITKESIHHFYKSVSGKVLTRPAWFMDTNQQGEGLVDVMTHLVDLVQWECFPGQIIDTTNIVIGASRRWPTRMTLTEFKAITKIDSFPSYLTSSIVADSVLNIFSNGEINYTINGVHAKTSVTWRYKAPEGAGDAHYSMMRGTKANLIILQGADENFKPVLYIEAVSITPADINGAFKKISASYPGVYLEKHVKGWKVIIPEKYNDGHEAHFASVMKNFLEYLKAGKLPDWEVPNMIAKYYTTTGSLEKAKTN